MIIRQPVFSSLYFCMKKSMTGIVIMDMRVLMKTRREASFSSLLY